MTSQMNPMETHGAVSWIEHSGPDTAKATAFYKAVLDWTITEAEMSDGPYSMIMQGDKPMGGFSPRPGAEGWKIFITVDDVDARVKTAQAEGATLAAEAMTVPGVGRMATIVDPFGAPLCLIDYSKA